MKQLQVNAILIVDLDGRYVLSSARSLETGEPIDLNLAAYTALPQDFPWLKNLRDGTSARGLVRTNHGVMMIAAAPVLDGSGTGPALGMVLMGRLLTPLQVQMLGAQAQAELTMLRDRFSGGTEIVESDVVTQVSKPFTDIYGKVLMRLRVDVPRRITARGQGAVNYASLYLIGAAVIVLVLLVVVVNRIVLKPLARVTDHAVEIAEGTELSVRLGIPGDDELAAGARVRPHGRAGRGSRRQLVDQSFQAGFAELAKGVLHNLGNAMTPIGVRVANLSERLRVAPAGDADLAIAELDEEPDRSARREDLEDSCAWRAGNWPRGSRRPRGRCDR